MKVVHLLVLVASAVGTACGDRPGTAKLRPDIVLRLEGVDFESRAWVAGHDAKLLAIASAFDAFGEVMLVELGMGTFEMRTEVALARSDRPLLWYGYERRYVEPESNATFDLPIDSLDREADVHLSNNGRGALVRLARSFDGSRMTLQGWNGQPAPLWTKEIAPLPIGAGLALSPAGDLVALVSVFDDPGPTKLTIFDARTGERRWQGHSALFSFMPQHVDEQVAFSDDGSAVYVHGSMRTKGQATGFEGWDAATGEITTRFQVEGALASWDGTLLAISKKTVSFGKVTYFDGNNADFGPFAKPDERPSWRCEYEEFALSSARARVDTSLHDADYARLFGNKASESCSTRAMLPVAGGVMFVRSEIDRLRVQFFRSGG